MSYDRLILDAASAGWDCELVLDRVPDLHQSGAGPGPEVLALLRILVPPSKVVRQCDIVHGPAAFRVWAAPVGQQTLALVWQRSGALACPVFDLYLDGPDWHRRAVGLIHRQLMADRQMQVAARTALAIRMVGEC